jgi:structural maintenance of chromosomes protein 5
MQDCRNRISELDAKLDELLIKKNQAVLQHKDMVSHIRDAHTALLDVQIRLLEAASDVRGLNERNGEITKGLEEKKEEIKRLADLAQEAKAEAVTARDKIMDSAGDDQARLQHLQEMVEGKSLEDIDHEISAEEAKLELIHVVNPSVLAQFEKRAKDIEEMTKKLDDANNKLGRLTDQTKELMEKFEPKLDGIIAQINQAFGHNFDMISCAGEVSLHKDDDFGQWAIEIKVKFRSVLSREIPNYLH